MSDLLFVVGPAGSGKSTASKLIAKRLGAAYLDKDTVATGFTEAILTLAGSDRDNRLASMALSADGERVVLSGYAYASDDGSYYASAMRARLHAGDLLRNGFE